MDFVRFVENVGAGGVRYHIAAAVFFAIYALVIVVFGLVLVAPILRVDRQRELGQQQISVQIKALLADLALVGSFARQARLIVSIQSVSVLVGIVAVRGRAI